MRPTLTHPERRAAAAMPNITGIQLLPHGMEASLVNISTTGLLAQSAARLPVGSAVKIVFAGGFVPTSVQGRVARCEVAAMGRDGLLRYHLAIEFDGVISLDVETQQNPATPAVNAPPPTVTPAAKNRW
jgi:hypothetical protein